MKERPIMFRGEMVRAVLAGRKTQTRRIVKPQPVFLPEAYDRVAGWLWKTKKYELEIGERADPNKATELISECPYGVAGDRLWVRETLRRVQDCDCCYPLALYDVDRKPVRDGGGQNVHWEWKQSVLAPIYMPRERSRLNLEIVNVRVERVQDITESEGIQEGCSARLLGEMLEALASRAKIFNYHWVAGGDEGIGYCYRCAKQRKNALRKTAKMKDRGEIVVDGGWSQEEDNSATCDTCGRLLNYTLTDHGVEAELEHFEQYSIKPTPRQAYQFHRVLNWAGSPILTERDYKPEWQGRLARICYRYLWDRINKARSYGWDTNPWVWVVEFKRVTP